MDDQRKPIVPAHTIAGNSLYDKLAPKAKTLFTKYDEAVSNWVLTAAHQSVIKM